MGDAPGIPSREQIEERWLAAFRFLYPAHGTTRAELGPGVLSDRQLLDDVLRLEAEVRRVSVQRAPEGESE